MSETQEVVAVETDEDIDMEKLIMFVEERPLLWDKSIEAYKDRNMNREAWREICHALFPGFEDKSASEKKQLESSINVPEGNNPVSPTEDIIDNTRTRIPAQPNKPKVKGKRKRNEDEFELNMMKILEQPYDEEETYFGFFRTRRSRCFKKRQGPRTGSRNQPGPYFAIPASPLPISRESASKRVLSSTTTAFAPQFSNQTYINPYIRLIHPHTSTSSEQYYPMNQQTSQEASNQQPTPPSRTPTPHRASYSSIKTQKCVDFEAMGESNTAYFFFFAVSTVTTWLALYSSAVQNMGAPHGTRRTKPTSCEHIQLPSRTACTGSCERALRSDVHQDLQSLLEFVPPIHHNYYQNLIHGKKEKKKQQQPKPSTSTTQEIYARARLERLCLIPRAALERDSITALPIDIRSCPSDIRVPSAALKAPHTTGPGLQTRPSGLVSGTCRIRNIVMSSQQSQPNNEAEKEVLVELIESLKENRCLWDTKCDAYANRDPRRAAHGSLLEIYKKFQPNATIDLLKKKIENLKCSFRRELRKVFSSRCLNYECLVWECVEPSKTACLQPDGLV
ncbi:hypothetical protein J6590_084886 [Homalodisca vitripennis]|nr:hypothetical protein J6590_084886 [Homalodisca vitripennis]